jgi:pyridoxal phosphate enzyme (YggS family)
METWRGGIEANLRDVRARLEAAAARAGRDPGLVRIMAVTKTVPAERIQHAVDLGLGLLGENRVQEAKEKLPLLKGEFAMHLIGHLQSNKAGVAADLFASVDSVDSVELAGRLSRLALERGRRLPVLLEVNTSGEPAKFGFEAAELEAASADWGSLPGLEVRGLMTLGPVPESGRDPRPCFAALRALRDRLQERLSRPFPELSMGMSGDFECGVEEGSTLIRVGSALFGPRRA